MTIEEMHIKNKRTLITIHLVDYFMISVGFNTPPLCVSLATAALVADT